MKEELLSLKEEAYFEPLFNHWYAWPYLISPVSGARHLVNTHLRIMKSFVNNYQLHIMANSESVLTGGEFLNCAEEQVQDIRDLIDEANKTCLDLIELSEAVKELDELLRKHTSGESIEYLYKLMPAPLRGYVELFLDLEHRPSYRLIEPLLYKSSYYKPSLQSASFGLLSRVGERPFILSTPRLPDENHLQIEVDYNSELLDVFFRSRDIPLTVGELNEVVAPYKQDKMKGGLFYLDLFSSQPSVYSYKPVNDGVRIQYTGHAGFLVETRSVSIMMDPVIANRSESIADQVISYSELPAYIDYVCLTHNHQDHINLESLLQLRHKIGKILVPKNNGGTLADPSIKLMLMQFGFDVTEVDDLEEIAVPGGRVVGIPFLGEHGDLNIRSKTAWYIELLEKKLFFGADSSNPDSYLYEHLGRIFNHIDLLAIGMECVGAPYTWLYGALHTKMVTKAIKDSRRLNGSDFGQAFQMVKAFNAKQVFIYALGLEPWYKYFMGIEYSDDSKQIVESDKLIEACKGIGVGAEKLFGKKIYCLT